MKNIEENFSEINKGPDKIKKYEKIGEIASNTGDIVAGVPFIGQTLQSIASIVEKTSKLAQNNTMKKYPNKSNPFFILPTANFYSEINNIVNKIMLDNGLMIKYKYDPHSYDVEIWDDFLYLLDTIDDVKEEDISYYISVNFYDDSYSYKDINNEMCSINISFIEKFKQINFEKNKVYSAFEIISNGGPSEGLGKRDYVGLSNEIVTRLCNGIF